MANTIVTVDGLNFMSSAHPAGPLFAIKYWVPVYDWRLDPEIRNDGQGLSATTDAITEAINRTYPNGEILWNKGLRQYVLSDDTNYQYILSGYGDSVNYGSNGKITGSKQTVGPVPINLYGTTPIGNYHKGDKGSFETSSVGVWQASNLVAAVGNNPTYSSKTSAYYPVIDFFPVKETGQTKVKAQFVCRLSEDIGSIKYNKIALYAIRYNGSGVVDSNPHFVGEAYLLSGYTIKKSRFGQGYNETTINTQLEFNMVSAWGDVFYGSSADYWSKVPNGLHSSEKISVGTFQDNNFEPKATAHFGRTIGTDGEYENNPNMRLQYENIAGQRYNYDFTVNSTGNLEISANGITTILPQKVINMGSTNYPFGQLVVSAIDTDLAAKGAILIKSSNGSLEIYRKSIEFSDTDVDYLWNNKYIGGDIQRNWNELILQSRKKSVLICPSIDEAAHANTINYWDNYNSMYDSSTYYDTSANTSAAATLYIMAKNGVKTKGPLELSYIPSKNYVTNVLGSSSSVLSFMADTGVVYSKENKVLLVAGSNYDTWASDQVNGSSKYFMDKLLSRLYNVVYTSYNSVYQFNAQSEGYISNDSEFHFMAYKNIVYGNFMPSIDDVYSVGDTTRRFNEIHGKKIDLCYNYYNDGGGYGNPANDDSFMIGRYSSFHNTNINQIRYLMRFTVPQYSDNSYFAIGDMASYPVDRIDVRELNIENGNNALGIPGGIYASDIDMTINNIDAYSVSSTAGYTERNRNFQLGEFNILAADAFLEGSVGGAFVTVGSNDNWWNDYTTSFKLSNFEYTYIGKVLIMKYKVAILFKDTPPDGNYRFDNYMKLNWGSLGGLESIKNQNNNSQIVPLDFVTGTSIDMYGIENFVMNLKITVDSSSNLNYEIYGCVPNVSDYLNNVTANFYVTSIYSLS